MCFIFQFGVLEGLFWGDKTTKAPWRRDCTPLISANGYKFCKPRCLWQFSCASDKIFEYWLLAPWLRMLFSRITFVHDRGELSLWKIWIFRGVRFMWKGCYAFDFLEKPRIPKTGFITYVRVGKLKAPDSGVFNAFLSFLPFDTIVYNVQIPFCCCVTWYVTYTVFPFLILTWDEVFVA